MIKPNQNSAGAGLVRRIPALGLVAVGVLGLGACGGDDGGVTGPTIPTPTTDVFVFDRNRDAGTGAIVPILTETGAGFDAREVDSPAVLIDPDRSDRYLLFYEAADAQGTSSIGVVSSNEPEMRSLAVGRTIAVAPGAPGSGYESGATDPTVVLEPAGAATRYRMWFEGRTGSASTIVTARSDDGVSWSDFAVCTGLQGAFRAPRVADPSVVVVNGEYRMWFEASDAIGYATSTDGIAWSVVGDGPVLGARGGTAFDAAGVHAPSVLFDPDAPAPWRWTLWYEASDVLASTENTIGVARSENGLTWTRLDLPVLSPSSDSIVPLPFDSGDLEHPFAAIDPNGDVLLWYTGDGEGNATPNRIGLARGELVPETATP